MDAHEQIAFKKRLKEFCRLAIEDRMASAKQLMIASQDAANTEEKSSAGDKYETSRAMGHLQKDMHARQYAGYLKELGHLHVVNIETIYTNAVSGAYLQTDDGSFFIAAGMGKQMVDGANIFFISPGAPLALSLQTKKQGDTFLFNGKTLTIAAIY